MLRLILVTLVALLALGTSSAFSSLPHSMLTTTQKQSSTAVFFFGKQKADEEGKGKKSSSKKGKDSEEKKKKPFVMMFGKPQYDWVKNEPIPSGANTKRMNWLYKPKK